MAVPLTLSSVPAQTPYVQYVSSASQTVFPYPFEITQDSDLVCLINAVQQPTDSGYSLTGQGTTSGGNLTFAVGQTAGTIITLYRNISISRITQLSQNGTFFSSNFNNEYNKIYLILQQLQQSLLPGGNQAFALMVPNSNSPQPTTLLTQAAYANKYLAFDANGNPEPAVLTSSGSLTASIIAGLLNGTPQAITIDIPQTTAEAAMSVVPVNLQYSPMSVDRYATNTTPGTTDMSGAFTKAVAVAQYAGGIVTYGATYPYLLTNAVNCTFSGTGNQHGVIIQGPDGGQDSGGTTPFFPLIIKHTKSAAFDCTGNDSIKFRDVSMCTDPTTYPKTGVLLARSATGGSQLFRADNLKIIGYFSVSCFYNYGSEDDVLNACYFQNFAPTAGTKTRVYTGNNISGIASAFSTDNFGNAVAIDTGTVSCIEHNSFGCQDINIAGTNTSDCIYLEQIDSFRSYGGFAISGSATASGRAAIYVDMSNAASNLANIDGLSMDNTAHPAAYFLAFSNHAQTPSGFSVRNIHSVTSTNCIAALGTNPTIDSLYVDNLIELVTRGMSIPGTLQNSTIASYLSMTVGTSTKNNIQGDATGWTITTTNGGSKLHTGAALTFAPGIVTATHGWTLVGALTQRARYTLIGNMVSFQMLLQGATSLACSAGATIPTLPVAAIDDMLGTIVDTATGVVTGCKITGTTITIPAAITTTADEILISGTYFVS